MGERRLLAAMVTAALLVSCDQSSVPRQHQQTGEDPKVIKPDVIYGSDDRRDLYEVQNPLLLDLAASTVALMQSRDLQRQTDGSYKIQSMQFGSAYGLCRSEPYFEQKIAAFCSGFLVAPDAIATAGHCIRSASDCRNTKFVFGFAVTAPGIQTESVDETQVYSCVDIIQSDVGNGGRDYSVVRLDRPVMGRPVLELRRQGTIADEQELVVIGHPAGLPVKVAGGAKVRSVSAEFFSANLDTYGGNSGSAVFNAQTGEVEGILVRGETDFQSRGGCRVSYQCSDSGCRGEDVTKISYVVEALQTSGGGGGGEPETYQVSFAGPVPIPDNQPQGVVAQVEADRAPEGRRVLAHVKIDHSWRGDLRVSLTAPDGTEVLLHNRSGGSKDDINGTFGADLESAEDLAPLSAVSATGTWTLRVSDHARRDVGSIQSFQLQFAP